MMHSPWARELGHQSCCHVARACGTQTCLDQLSEAIRATCVGVIGSQSGNLLEVTLTYSDDGSVGLCSFAVSAAAILSLTP